MVNVAILGIFILVAATVFFVAWLLDQQRAGGRVIHERLAAVQQAQARGEASEELALLRDELLSEIPALNRLLARARGVSRLQRLLSQADMKMRAGKFLLICASAAGFGGLLFQWWSRLLLFGLFGAVLGGAIPFAVVMYKRSQRFHKFEELFPEAIDLLGRAVRAGHAFTTALELIATELSEPVGGEFRKLFEEQKFGLPVREALLNLAERVPVIDVKFFVTAIMLQRETGGNLAEILDKLSYVIRERFKVLRQVRVYTAQGRLTMAILMGLPPALVIMLAILNREFVSVLWTDPIGHLLIAAGVLLQVIGFVMIRRIIHIQV